MSIQATDLIDFARSLTATTNLPEVGRRAAVSRAYYAAYHDSDQWYRQLPAPGSLGTSNVTGMHAQLCIRLQTPDGMLSPELKVKSRKRGYALRALRDCRTKADYHLAEDVSQAEVHQAIENAYSILALT